MVSGLGEVNNTLWWKKTQSTSCPGFEAMGPGVRKKAAADQDWWGNCWVSSLIKAWASWDVGTLCNMIIVTLSCYIFWSGSIWRGTFAYLLRAFMLIYIITFFLELKLYCLFVYILHLFVCMFLFCMFFCMFVYCIMRKLKKSFLFNGTSPTL